MKKHKFVFYNLLCFILLFFAWSSFTSCKSVPAINEVDPLNLLDDKSGFYISIPKAADPQLIERMISKHIPGLSEKNIKKISDRTTKIYCGLNKNKSETFIQASIEGNIPTSFIPRILSRKNGWDVRDYDSSISDSIKNHKIYSYNNIDLSFPSSNSVCVGRDLNYMLDKYDQLFSLPKDESISGNFMWSKYSDLPVGLYDFLKGAESEIRFYANEPKSFLTILTGRNLDLKLVDVIGSFSVDENFPQQYLLNITFNFKENKYLKAGRALLSIVFGLTNSNINFLSDHELEIKGIEIDKEQLYKILIL